ncbi:MAG: hypothetical protein R2791_20705 [Saprospiraceae bacterium]
MKKVLLLMVFFALNGHSYAQDGIKPFLHFMKDTLRADEVWEFKIGLTNNGSLPGMVCPIYFRNGWIQYGVVSLEMRAKTDSVWSKIDCLKNKLKDERFSKLEPNDTITSNLLLCSPKILARDSLQVRVYYANCSSYNKDKLCLLYSDPVTIYFSEYSGEDKLAHEYLLTLPDPHFIYKYVFDQTGYDARYIDQALELTERYPNSIFAPFAELYLCLAYYMQAQTQLNVKANKEESVNYIRRSRKHGFSALNGTSALVAPLAKQLLIYETEFVDFDIFQGDTPRELRKELNLFYQN